MNGDFRLARLPQGAIQRIRVDLSQPLDHKEFFLKGEWLLVAQLANGPNNDETAYVDTPLFGIQFNSPNGQTLPLIPGMKYRYPFEKIFITTPGLSGAFVDLYAAVTSVDMSQFPTGLTSSELRVWSQLAS